MTPSRGNTILFRSSRRLPRLRLGPLKGFLSRHGTLQGPSTCHDPCALLMRNNRETRAPPGVVLGCVGPKTPSTTTDANLDCAFVENALFYTDP